jgi:formate/nitrite transporter FocA (FNT family)
VLAIVFPISAFVAAGFEHSIANLYFLPMGLLLSNHPAVVEVAQLPPDRLAGLDAAGLLTNITAATLGNVVGGGVLVGLVYWFVYLRPQSSETS